MRQTVSWSFMVLTAGLASTASAQVPGLGTDRGPGLGLRAAEQRQAVLESRGLDARAATQAEQRLEAGLGRTEGLLDRGSERFGPFGAAGQARMEHAAEARLNGPSLTNRPDLPVPDRARLDAALQGRLDAAKRPDGTVPPPERPAPAGLFGFGGGLFGRGTAPLPAPPANLSAPGLPADSRLSADATISTQAGVGSGVGMNASLQQAADGGLGSQGRPQSNPDRILAQRLSQIDAMRERAVAESNEQLLLQADHLEQIARRNHDQMAGQADVRATTVGQGGASLQSELPPLGSMLPPRGPMPSLPRLESLPRPNAPGAEASLGAGSNGAAQMTFPGFMPMTRPVPNPGMAPGPRFDGPAPNVSGDGSPTTPSEGSTNLAPLPPAP